MTPSQDWQQTSDKATIKTTEAAEPSATQQENKLNNGPCADTYALLEKCKVNLGIQHKSGKVAMALCVSETDLLIKCIKKHPLHFHDPK